MKKGGAPTSLAARMACFPSLIIFPVIFVVIFFLHGPVLRLPFFWDEAGFYVPAAHDLLQFHSLIPKTTLDTGHPPLPAAYLAIWFALSGLRPAVARIAELLLAAFALTNVFLLARRVANTPVAIASTVATAVYPIFFVQSSLAHADLAAAAFTIWGLRLRFENRTWLPQFAFCLAVLSKETAIITPAVLAGWEFFHGAESSQRKNRFKRAAIWLSPALPLLAWLAYHREVTVRFFGSSDFYQYNVVAVISPLRFALALGLRLWHLLGIMNMAALTAATAVA
ncbi:MAG: glycosyltransferase family 39 protein, partial [Candidatus Angelobacter sp.]